MSMFLYQHVKKRENEKKNKKQNTKRKKLFFRKRGAPKISLHTRREFTPPLKTQGDPTQSQYNQVRIVCGRHSKAEGKTF